MKNKLTETKQSQALLGESELVLDNDEIEQLAKFLDALLEVDLAAKSDEGNDND